MLTHHGNLNSSFHSFLSYIYYSPAGELRYLSQKGILSQNTVDDIIRCRQLRNLTTKTTSNAVTGEGDVDTGQQEDEEEALVELSRLELVMDDFSDALLGLFIEISNISTTAAHSKERLSVSSSTKETSSSSHLTVGGRSHAVSNYNIF